MTGFADQVKSIYAAGGFVKTAGWTAKNLKVSNPGNVPLTAITEAVFARSLARCRQEAAKCVLLCANCHAEVEAGVAELPYVPARRAAA